MRGARVVLVIWSGEMEMLKSDNDIECDIQMYLTSGRFVYS